MISKGFLAVDRMQWIGVLGPTAFTASCDNPQHSVRSCPAASSLGTQAVRPSRRHTKHIEHRTSRLESPPCSGQHHCPKHPTRQRGHARRPVTGRHHDTTRIADHAQPPYSGSRTQARSALSTRRDAHETRGRIRRLTRPADRTRRTIRSNPSDQREHTETGCERAAILVPTHVSRTAPIHRH